MRPPWDYGLGAADDAESLQTDVMRFIAILGLCLTAIFSLVNAAREESQPPVDLPAAVQQHEAPVQAKTSPAVREVLPVPVPGSDVEPGPGPPSNPETSPEPVPERQPAGFTLEFFSEETLRALNDAGSVQVYAIAGDVFWLLDAGGQLHKASPPASYYQMDEATLPRSIVQAAKTAGFAEGVKWGVTLPMRTAQDIQSIMSGGDGGALIIEGDGSVDLE